MPKPLLNSLLFHLHTLWLFTVSDHKPLVYPMTVTGILNMLAGPILNTDGSSMPSAPSTMQRVPVVIFWIWLNFLVFCIGNQCLSKAVAEDEVNKPWRPLPSKRLTEPQAKMLHIGMHLAALAADTQLGATEYTVVLMLLGWAYNDLEGGSNYVTRNLINAIAVVCFALGATTVAYGETAFVLNAAAWRWFVMIALVVFTTLQVQDLCDQEGDRARDRRTIPIVVGDIPSRWTVAIPVAFWSIYLPWFWDLPWHGFIGPAAVGGMICWRVLTSRGAQADRTTYRFWGFWIACLLALPFLKRVTET